MRHERSIPARPGTANPSSRESFAPGSRLPSLPRLPRFARGAPAGSRTRAICTPGTLCFSYFVFRFSILLSSISFLLTYLSTLAPATPLFSHTSQKHPGVVWAHSNSCSLCNLRTLYLATCATAPYPWPIALRFSRCHNEFSGQLPAGCALCLRRSLEGGRLGQETFLRSVVSNKLSGRGLSIVLPIHSAKRPVAGKRFLGRQLWRKPAWASSPASASCCGTS